MIRPLLARAPTSPIAIAYARAPAINGATPWRHASFCVIDLELSGLDASRDEIISFAAVPIEAGRVIASGAVYGLCRPTRPLPETSILVHGIRTIDLVDAPPLDEAIQPLVAAMTGRVAVAHSAWVEESFLRQPFARQGVRLRKPLLDTSELGRLLAHERREPPASDSLEVLATSLRLPVHRPHHALGDALTTAQVFITLATHLDQVAPETVRSLARARERNRLHVS